MHLTLAGSSLLQIGDALSVKLDSSAAYKHSTNIYKTRNSEVSDGIFTLTPGAIFNAGKPGANLNFKLKTYRDFIEYKNNPQLDVNLSKHYFDMGYAPNSSFNGSLSYSQIDGQTARSVLDIQAVNLGLVPLPPLVETESKSYSYFLSYQLSPKSSFSLGLNNSKFKFDPNYNNKVLASKNSTTVPLKLYYQYSDKLNLVYGITSTKRKIGSRTDFTQTAYETDSFYYNIGLKGAILPKLSGNFDIGYHTLKYSTSTDDYNGIGFTSSLVWTINPKIRTTLNLSRNFDSAGSGRTYQATIGRLSTVYSLNSEFQMSFNLSRTDKFYKADSNLYASNAERKEYFDNLSLNLHYLPSANYNFTIGYDFARGVIKNNSASDYNLREFRFISSLMY